MRRHVHGVTMATIHGDPQGQQFYLAAQFAGDGRIPVTGDGAHPFAGRRNLERGGEARQQGQHFGSRKRQLRIAHREKAVTEGVEFVAIDPGDGAVGPGGHVARHQLHRDHRARLQLPRITLGARPSAAQGLAR